MISSTCCRTAPRLISNDSSALGAGWSLAGDNRLVIDPSGNILRLEGDGTAACWASASGDWK
jgi:hypothetical protein